MIAFFVIRNLSVVLIYFSDFITFFDNDASLFFIIKLTEISDEVSSGAYSSLIPSPSLIPQVAPVANPITSDNITDRLKMHLQNRVLGQWL